MELTGKCKEVFELWYIEVSIRGRNLPLLGRFYKIDESFKYSLYVEFFWFNKIPVAHDWIPIILKNISLEDYRIETIEKANEIYNDAH